MNELLLLDLYRNPTHFAEHKKYTHRATAENSHCGDEIAFQLLIVDDVIKKMTFSGAACSVCLATAEYLSRQLQGKPIKELSSVDRNAVFALFGVDESHKRSRCFTLPFEALETLTVQLKKENNSSH